MDRIQFAHFADALTRHGAEGVDSTEFVMGAVGRYSLRYIPFEHVNRSARLVIVGITPGNNQLRLAYATAQKLMSERVSPEVILHEIKKEATFGGPNMRPNLLRMLRHFRFQQLLGIDNVESLWGKDAELLHATSVVPNAAFKSGRMFAGSFEEVMQSPLLSECFEDCLVPSLATIGKDALYVGLGPCPQDALAYCARLGVIEPSQVLGAFCHPSTSGGSKTAYYLRERGFESLDPRDPTRAQTKWLDAAYEHMRIATARLAAGPLGAASATPNVLHRAERTQAPTQVVGAAKVASPRSVPSTSRSANERDFYADPSRPDRHGIRCHDQHR